MLTEERYAVITEMVNQRGSIKLTDLCDMLGISVSTARRDINALDEMGKITKVHGGAVSRSERFFPIEENVEEKMKQFSYEKGAIARYAASLLDDGDFAFIDAGTTTEKMIDYLPLKKVTFVTNGIIHAKKLAHRGFKVYIPGGEIRLATEAIVGAESVMTMKEYNFTKCFLGVNGISVSAGYSTPDISEARVKTTIVENSQLSYILADHSKFDKITSVTFAKLQDCKIITDKLPDRKYLNYTSIKEVM